MRPACCHCSKVRNRHVSCTCLYHIKELALVSYHVISENIVYRPLQYPGGILKTNGHPDVT